MASVFFAAIGSRLAVLLAVGGGEGLDLAVLHGLDIGLGAIAAIGRHLGGGLADVGHAGQLAAVGGAIGQAEGDDTGAAENLITEMEIGSQMVVVMPKRIE